MTTCVVGRSDLPAVEQLAQKNGFQAAPSDAARHYLYGNPGKAWVLENEQGHYGLSLLAANHLCSIFVHQGDPDDIQASMEAWLPKKDSGYTFTKQIISSSGDLRTTAYDIIQGPKIVERWVITINYSQSSGLVAIMSYTGAEASS
ncbi:hypothetical protein EA58_20240 [Photobacterium galatheae]|uniref:Uncharacterized protein n=2 Tax=Photobacterium galatheae TaxID=1654360 RepID=A0A066RHJ8_9GAMM|nr:hypothetical protein EA58_20240 [Photobacterium galatheae]